MKTPDLETLLRAAPRPAAPPELARRLQESITLTPLPSSRRSRPTRDGSVSKWWLGLIACGLAAGAAGIAWQQSEIRALQTQLAAAALTPSVAETGASPVELPLDDPRSEMERLRKEIAQRLADAELAQQAALTVSNGAEAATADFSLSAEAAAALDAAAAKAASIKCVNNLKQIGLAIRIYATDHEDKFPVELGVIQAELGTPKILVCPIDPNHHETSDWATYSAANLSYEYLAPDGSETDPNRVLTRCSVHGHVGLCDGSVHMNSTNRPLRIVNRQGKLYQE